MIVDNKSFLDLLKSVDLSHLQNITINHQLYSQLLNYIPNSCSYSYMHAIFTPHMSQCNKIFFFLFYIVQYIIRYQNSFTVSFMSSNNKATYLSLHCYNYIDSTNVLQIKKVLISNHNRPSKGNSRCMVSAKLRIPCNMFICALIQQLAIFILVKIYFVFLFEVFLLLILPLCTNLITLYVNSLRTCYCNESLTIFQCCNILLQQRYSQPLELTRICGAMLKTWIIQAKLLLLPSHFAHGIFLGR